MPMKYTYFLKSVFAATSALRWTCRSIFVQRIGFWFRKHTGNLWDSSSRDLDTIMENHEKTYEHNEDIVGI